MAETHAMETAPAQALRETWQALRREEPRIRMKDAADRLGVSEAELLAARCGLGVRRLTGPWGDLLQALPLLGEVMVLTRNEHVVHEKTGTFGNVSVFKAMGLVLNREIDLRVLLNRWASGFAVTEETASGVRHSLQFFARDGTAVHKVYLPADAHTGAYEELVGDFLSDDQTPGETVRAATPDEPESPDSEVDVARFRTEWQALTDVHDFMSLLRRHRVGRVQALRLAGSDLARPMARDSFIRALEGAAETGLSIMVFVGSPGVIQIHTGPVNALKRVGPWFNVLDPGFNLHLRDGDIASAWLVRKPTKDGIVTSLEIYDAGDRQIALMFGERHEGEPENPAWRALLETLQGVDA